MQKQRLQIGMKAGQQLCVVKPKCQRRTFLCHNYFKGNSGLSPFYSSFCMSLYHTDPQGLALVPWHLSLGDSMFAVSLDVTHTWQSAPHEEGFEKALGLQGSDLITYQHTKQRSSSFFPSGVMTPQLGTSLNQGVKSSGSTCQLTCGTRELPPEPQLPPATLRFPAGNVFPFRKL